VSVGDPPRFRFPRSGRLRKRPEFLAVQSTGKKVHTEYFLVLVDREGAGRVGITGTKKTGNAVTRNRLKRQVREYVRLARAPEGSWLPPDRDVVIVAKRAAAGRSSAELARDLARSGPRVASC
jgi:ribonuclease P protein component